MRLDLERLRRQARELQRTARASGSEMKLSAAQLAVAREHGFASWTRLKRAVETAKELGFDSALASTTGNDVAGEFCRLACLTYARDDGPERWAQARRLLAEQPRLTEAN